MQRGVAIFIGGVVVITAAVMAAGAPLMAKSPQIGGLLLGISVIIPMVMALIAHRASGGSGNPFKGLVWGSTSWYFLAWLGGLLVGAIVAGMCIGLNFAHFDPSMTDYIDMMKEQAQKKSNGQEIPSQALGMFRIIALCVAFLGPTIGAWFTTAFACLSSFPWLGWLYRRLMVGGRVQGMLILMGVWMLVGLTGGLIENPLMAGVSMPIRMALGGLMSAASGPAVVWIFLRTRSAVIPALAQTSFQTMLAAATVMLSDINPTLGLPTGAIAILIALVTGVALWVWKDPGGESLAIAAVANDGTPLTAQQVGAMDAPVQVPPPPPQA